MNELSPLHLVFRCGDDVATDSRRIASAFGKRHSDVIRAIELLDCPQDFAKRNFALCYEINELQNGKPIKFYQISEKGAMFLIMGFTGKAAALVKVAFIEAFDFMRQQMNSYQRYCSLVRLRDDEAQAASLCGRGLNDWKWRKRWFDLELTQLQRDIQLPLFG